MIRIDSFTFNPFQENTYILSDQTSECVIIDPGCYSPSEKEELFRFIQNEKLKPARLLNTHCHIDHVLGNNFVSESFGVQLELHLLEIPLLRAAAEYGPQFDIYLDPVKEPLLMIQEGAEIKFGKSKLKTMLTPGHSPGSLTFIAEEEKFIVSGDVLFRQGIGRTDLPGGNYNTLMQSIENKLFKLSDEYKVYSGHGPVTTIGFEKKNNPFFN